jgi:hypothetical protein
MSRNQPIILSIVLVTSIQAQTADPLWLKAQAQVQGTRNLVASEISSHTEILLGDGKHQDIIDKKTRLTGWRDGEPVRSVVSLTETQKEAGMGDAKLDFGVANHPEKWLAEILTIQRQEEVILNTKSCVVFRVTGKRSGKVPFTAKAWIERATALPLRVEYTFDPSGMPLTKSMNYSTVYGRSAEGHWVPRTVVVETVMSVIFMKVKMTMRQDLDGWIPRPSPAQPERIR